MVAGEFVRGAAFLGGVAGYFFMSFVGACVAMGSSYNETTAALGVGIIIVSLS